MADCLREHGARGLTLRGHFSPSLPSLSPASQRLQPARPAAPGGRVAHKNAAAAGANWEGGWGESGTQESHAPGRPQGGAVALLRAAKAFGGGGAEETPEPGRVQGER